MRSATYIVILLLALPAFPLKNHAQPAVPEFDLIIAGGRIVDGTGNPWFEADLAVKDGRIASLGHIARTARRGELCEPTDCSPVSSTCILISKAASSPADG
jgi:hypothetical protein